MRLTYLSKYAAVAAAVAAPLAAAAPASATSAGTGSAFGVSASGLAPIQAMPTVTSERPPSHKSLFELPPNPLVQLGILRVGATPGHARASVVDLKVVPAELSAHLITATCGNGRGSAHLVQASLGGRKLAVAAAPNSSLSVPVNGVGTVSVVLNKQVRTPDGGLSVTALQLSVPLPTGGAETVSVSNATCKGESGGTGNPGQPPSHAPTPPHEPGEAPAPTPVPSDLPVTG
jgi:hypothetical protein